jgi:tyrosyl-tRNA synthetase
MTKKKDPKDKLKTGRPTKYTPEMAERICELVATTDMGYTRISEMYPELPDRSNVNKWRRKYPEFRAMYAQAKCEQIEFMTEEILEIADDATNDWMAQFDKKKGCVSWQVNGEHIQRSRVRIDTRKWLAAKLVPRIYGDAKEEEQNNTIHDDVVKRKHELDEKNKKEF